MEKVVGLAFFQTGIAGIGNVLLGFELIFIEFLVELLKSGFGIFNSLLNGFALSGKQAVVEQDDHAKGRRSCALYHWSSEDEWKAHCILTTETTQLPDKELTLRQATRNWFAWAVLLAAKETVSQAQHLYGEASSASNQVLLCIDS